VKTGATDHLSTTPWKPLYDGDPGNNYRVYRETGPMARLATGRAWRDHLDYMQGFSASPLWICTSVKNIRRGTSFDGYHASLGQDLTAASPHFGDIPRCATWSTPRTGNT
jgi:hypothetical protein